MVKTRGLHAELRVPRDATSGIVAKMLSDLPIAYVAIEETPIEDVITHGFGKVAKGRAKHGETEDKFA